MLYSDGYYNEYSGNQDPRATFPAHADPDAFPNEPRGRSGRSAINYGYDFKSLATRIGHDGTFRGKTKDLVE